MNDLEIDQLNKCIELLAMGGSVDDCIHLFPRLTLDAVGALRTAAETIKLGDFQVPAESMEKSRAMLLERAAVLATAPGAVKPQPGENSWLMRLRGAFSFSPTTGVIIRRLGWILGIVALLVFFSRGLVITSAKSLPGDSLYPVKRAVEDIRVYLSTNQQNKLEYEQDFNQERVGEVIKLIQLNRVQKISFEGVLEEKNSTQWVVSGIPVNIQASTIFLAGLSGPEEFVSGSVVEVEGTTISHGGVNAIEIHLREYQLRGTVEKIDPDTWLVSGVKMPINSGTRIEDGIIIGDRVVVFVRSEDNGFYALSIHSEGQVTPLPDIQQPRINTPVPDDASTAVHEVETQDHQPAISPEANESPDPPDQEEMHETPVAPSEEEHISTPTPQSTEEPEHDGGSSTPEYHESDEPTDTHEGEP